MAADASESACTRACCSEYFRKRQRMMDYFQVNMLECMELSSTRRCAHMCTDEDGIIGAHEAPAFFLPSGLPGDVLSRIWRLSAPDNALRTPVSAASALTEAGSAILWKQTKHHTEKPHWHISQGICLRQGVAY